MKQEPKNSQILKEIRALGKSMNKRFNTHDEFFIAIKQSFNHIDDRFSKVDDRLDLIEASMSTKNQFDKLVDILEDNKIVSSTNVKFVKSTS